MTATSPMPFAFGRIRVSAPADASSPNLNDPRVVAALLDDARRVAREESSHRRRLAGIRRRSA